jgi:hypothetical protein
VPCDAGEGAAADRARSVGLGEAWEQALAEARETLDDRVLARLLATPMLGDLLEEGLAEVGEGSAEG